MTITSSSQLEMKKERAVELWNRAVNLSQQEWGELYTLCFPLLIETDTSYKIKNMLRHLHEDADALFSQFFMQKVLQTVSAGGGLIHVNHVGSVREFFYRFLIDQKRVENNRPQSSIQQKGEEALDSDDWIENHVSEEAVESVSQLLEQTQHDIDYFRQASMEWIDTLSCEEKLLLRCSFEEKVTASKVASHYGIASYAYKAKKIGIVKASKSLQGLDYSTHLMKWFIQLGLNPPEDYVSEIAGLLKILAQVSLNYITLDDSLVKPTMKKGHRI